MGGAGDQVTVYLSGWFAGSPVGSGQYTDALAAALPEAGVAVALIRPPRRGPVAKLAFEQLLLPRATGAADWPRRLLHVPYWGPPLVSGLPVVVTVHDLIPLVVPAYRGGLMGWAYSALAGAATRRAAAVIADSAWTAGDIRSRLRIADERLHVVPLGVDSRYRPGVAPSGLAGLPARYGLYLGGFDPRKGVEFLVQVWDPVFAATGVPLILAGGGRAAARYTHPVGPAAHSPAVRYIGPVTEADKPGLYSGAAVFAYPSRYEGFGLPPLEAMASGTPVVARRATSLPEVVGDAGILVGGDDPGQWAQAIQAVLDDGDLSGRLRAAGLRRAEKFTWSRTATATASVYREVAR